MVSCGEFGLISLRPQRRLTPAPATPNAQLHSDVTAEGVEQPEVLVGGVGEFPVEVTDEDDLEQSGLFEVVASPRDPVARAGGAAANPLRQPSAGLRPALSPRAVAGRGQSCE